METDEVEPLLDPKLVSDWLQIPVRTLYEWRKTGTGPRSIKVGRHVRYRRLDVEVWLEGASRAS